MSGPGPESDTRVHTRELTPAERAALRAGPPSTWPGAALILLIWCVFPSLIFGWLARQFGLDGPLSHLVGAALGLALFLALWVPTRRATRALKRCVEADVQKGVVQVLAARGARFLVPEHPPSEPQLVVRLGGVDVLALQGEWLTEGPRFGYTAPDTDWDDRHFNGLPEPWAFPASAFTLHRLPISGQVLRVEVQGPYVKPAETDDLSLFPLRLQDSTLLASTSDS